MNFSDKELEKLKSLVNIYFQAKSIIIFSEEINPESKSNLQIIKELRDAYDHLIRVIENKLNGSTERNRDYNYLNLDKALGHTYRAAYDAADGCALSLKEKIYNTVNGHTSDVIVQVIREYFDYKLKIDEISKRISDHRTKKDSGDLSKDVLSGYIEDLEELKEIYLVFQTHMRSIIELEKDVSYKEKINTRKAWKIGIITGIISTIIGAILGILLS